MQLHVVGHIAEHLRLTTWTVRRDAALEAAIAAKVEAARLYYSEVIREFDRTHALPSADVAGDPFRPLTVPGTVRPAAASTTTATAIPEATF